MPEMEATFILGFQDASLWDSALGGFAHATVFAPPGLEFDGEKLDSPPVVHWSTNTLMHYQCALLHEPFMLSDAKIIRFN